MIVSTPRFHLRCKFPTDHVTVFFFVVASAFAMYTTYFQFVKTERRYENDGYRVLNHGDFWINNILFNYDEESGKPLETLFVDHQMSYYTSPAYDLHFFFHTSPQSHIRENQREDLLRIYYDSFVKTLKDVNHKNIPTFQDLQTEVRKKEMFGFIIAVIALPVVLMEAQSTQGSGFDGFVDQNIAQEMTRIMFSGKSFTEAMKYILRRYDGLGLFDTI